MSKAKKVLILGGTGMLGHLLLRYLSAYPEYDVYATARSLAGLEKKFPENLQERFRPGSVDANYFDSIIRALASIQTGYCYQLHRYYQTAPRCQRSPYGNYR